MLTAPDALNLARILVDGLGRDVDHGTADEDAAGMTPLERSAFEEFANVTVAGVLGGLGDHVHEAIHPSPPIFVYDMAGSVLDGIVSSVADADEMLFAARTKFSQDTRDASGVLLVVPAAAE
jgi:chemotaxis protein CheY-P-specific phosphatase CheC